MREHKLDFHCTFRKLSFFRTSFLYPPSYERGTPETSCSRSPLEKFIGDLLEFSPEIQTMDHTKAARDWITWLEGYAQRIDSERSEWGEDIVTERENSAKGANPRFVLRQWLLEEVIAKVEMDSESGKRLLAKVLHVSLGFIFFHYCIGRSSLVQMACNPFESWGTEEKSDEGIDAEVREERRYCGMGEKKMLGFQCSCSS